MAVDRRNLNYEDCFERNVDFFSLNWLIKNLYNWRNMKSVSAMALMANIFYTLNCNYGTTVPLEPAIQNVFERYVGKDGVFNAA